MEIVKKLEQWYNNNKRILPWRETKEPYRIWLSEVILQQTRISQGLPYYERFVENYPTVSELAKASQDDVLKLWEGLGYYSRARNLHAAAKQIVNDYQGNFPGTYAELLNIKGIGPYTAAAISSICFNEKKGVVDGNVYRVLSRLFGIETPINSSVGQKQFSLRAQELVAQAYSPGDYNQAIMEFGATHCTPKSPGCKSCIFSKDCIAFNTGMVESLPRKEKSNPLKNRYLNYIIANVDGKIAVQKRSEGDIWAGLYEFPLLETPETTNAKTLQKMLDISTMPVLISGQEKHILSHQRLWISFWQIQELPQDRLSNILFIKPEALTKLAFPIVLKRFVESNLLLLPHRLK